MASKLQDSCGKASRSWLGETSHSSSQPQALAILGLNSFGFLHPVARAASKEKEVLPPLHFACH